MNENARLMDDFNKQLRESAKTYVSKKEEKSPSVLAPYVMKYQSECDYFS